MCPLLLRFFFFNDTATTEIYTLSLHDALPISATPTASMPGTCTRIPRMSRRPKRSEATWRPWGSGRGRSEEHTSELQSQSNLVCRLLLEKKKKRSTPDYREHSVMFQMRHSSGL